VSGSAPAVCGVTMDFAPGAGNVGPAWTQLAQRQPQRDSAYIPRVELQRRPPWNPRSTSHGASMNSVGDASAGHAWTPLGRQRHAWAPRNASARATPAPCMRPRPSCRTERPHPNASMRTTASTSLPCDRIPIAPLCLPLRPRADLDRAVLRAEHLVGAVLLARATLGKGGAHQ
jgi:hypothetical protein